MERTSILDSRVYAGTEIGDEPKANLWFGLAKVSLLILIGMLSFAFETGFGWLERTKDEPKAKGVSPDEAWFGIRNEPNVRLSSRE